MTKLEFTRDMYLLLAEMLENKDPTSRILKEFGINAPTLSYRKKLLLEQKDILTWNLGELHLLETCQNIDDYVIKCMKLYGKQADRKIYIEHWKNRDKYLAKWKKEKQKTKKQKIIEIPSTVMTFPRKEESKRKDPLPDVGDQMATLINAINLQSAAIIDIIKEMVKVQKDTYELFKELRDNTVKNNGKPNKSSDP